MFFQLSSKDNKRYLLLLIVCLISLSLRVWLLDKRWINPDEGAHLMDAVLALDGKIPAVDYHSRQPLYTYAIAGTFKLFGINYVSGRLLPLTCSMLVGFLIFLMARMLFDEKVALLSAAIYWMLPLELMNSVIVKTEPLVTLLICLSLYTVVLFSRSNRAPWLIAAGVFAAMGFYVRQSALIVPLTAFGFLLFFHKGRLIEIAKSFGFFLIGYIGVFLLVLISYSNFMEVGDLLTSGLNPFGFLASSAKRLAPFFGMSVQSADSLTSPGHNVSYHNYNLYYRYVRQAFYMHSFLLVGLGFSVMSLCRQFLSRDKLRGKEPAISYSLLYLWAFVLFMAYAFFYHTRGFYIDYSREFLPPLVIIFSAWICNFITALRKDGVLERFILIGLCLSAILFIVQSSYKVPVGMVTYACLTIALFVLFVVGRALFGGKTRVIMQNYQRLMGHSIVLSAFVLSLTYSANSLSLAYHSSWSPQSLKETSAYISANTRASDTVMSGAVIWELQALRKPFLNISHPLAFVFNIPKNEKERIRSALLTTPPELIILDGYTEKTYFRHLSWLTDFLQERYELVKTAGPAKYPVTVYQLREIV